jgi:hypothetical protein
MSYRESTTERPRLSDLKMKPPSPTSKLKQDLAKSNVQNKQQQQKVLKQEQQIKTKKRQERNNTASLAGPAKAAERIRQRRRKERHKHEHKIDMLVTVIPDAVDATHIMRLLSPRLAPRYSFQPSLIEEKDIEHVRQLTSEGHSVFG